MLYGTFRKNNPDQLLYGSETASTISSRGEYLFPVEENKDGGKIGFHMSSYDLYAPRWAQPPDWEFKAQDELPEVAGEFVWTGFDYLGEPTPFNSDLTVLSNYHTEEEKEQARAELEAIGKIKVPARSSYFGIVDLAGFKKDRFYIYQARWRPDLPMAHILPHWNWPDRIGQVTPVHVYTSGDEAELFLNGKSLGRKTKGKYEYRLRWDDVIYEPGTVKVVAYKNGEKWAEDRVETTGPAQQLKLEADRARIEPDGRDLAFITASIMDDSDRTVPVAQNALTFEIKGPGTLVATDNGDPTDLTSFQSAQRNAFNGLALAIIRADAPGPITLRVSSKGLESAQIIINP
jgi:beta-galactosidase